MDSFMQADFLVLNATLRAIYQYIASGQHHTPQELEGIADKLTTLSGTLNQFVSRAIEDPDGEHASTVAKESFEDVIVLLWQIVWLLSQKGLNVTALHDQLKKLQSNLRDSFVAYDGLATEIILHNLGDFGLSIQWHDQFEELDASLRSKLVDIDKQIQQFSILELPAESERLRRLVMVFFDCYLGFQQRQDVDMTDPYLNLIRESWQRRFRKYKMYSPTGKKFLCTYSGGIDSSMRLNTYWMSKAIDKVAHAEGKSAQYLTRELGEFLQSLDSLRHVQIPVELLKEILEHMRKSDITEVDESSARNLASRLTNLSQAQNMPGDIQAPVDLLKAILGYIKITNSGAEWTSKVDIQSNTVEDMWDLVDLMNEIVREVGGTPSLGGAAVTGAQALATLEAGGATVTGAQAFTSLDGLSKVHLLIPFASPDILELLDQNIKILWYDNSTKKLLECNTATLKESKQPVIHNFIVEFSPGSPIVYCPSCGGSVIPGSTDRLIVRNNYAYYLPDGRIDRNMTQQNATRLKVNGLFGFDSGITNSLSSENRRELAQEAADKRYDILFVAGLQSLHRTVQKVTEQELELFYNQETKIHIEVSGDKNLDWLTEVISRYVYSASVGEELNLLFQAAKKRDIGTKIDLEERLSEEEKLGTLEGDLQNKPRGYQKAVLALEVAHTLNLKRLYVHDLDIDIIVRQGELSEEERSDEIHADLIAKWVVLRKLMSRGQISQSETRDTMTQIKEEGFTTLVETAQALYERLQQDPSTVLELYGTYIPEYDRTVILIPIRWVYGAVQDQLRVIGAGDTTSIVSAAQAL